MPQSLSQVFLHVVFSTKNRQPWLTPEVRPRMHAFLAAVGREVGAEVYRVGGVEDHVHLAVRLPRTLTQADLLEAMKKHSSRWIKELDAECEGFAWQRGYGAFSVSRGDLEALNCDIDDQEEHHRAASFQEEYRGLLDAAGIEYDERYVWD